MGSAGSSLGVCKILFLNGGFHFLQASMHQLQTVVSILQIQKEHDLSSEQI